MNFRDLQSEVNEWARRNFGAGSHLGYHSLLGVVEELGENLSITANGLSALGIWEPLPEGRELLGYWLRELGNSGAARMLEVLAGRYPKSMSDEELAQAAGLSESSGTFGTYLSKLRTLELVTGGRNERKASEELF